jgi:hypothetical protein
MKVMLDATIVATRVQRLADDTDGYWLSTACPADAATFMYFVR